MFVVKQISNFSRAYNKLIARLREINSIFFVKLVSHTRWCLDSFKIIIYYNY